MKLDPKTWDEDWVGNPNSTPLPGTIEYYLVENRVCIDVLGYVEDKNADYSYNDYAVIELYGQHYLLNTSGCSCPSPSETWLVDFGPATKEEIIKHLGTFHESSVPYQQEEEFLEILK